jgi:hypothetical protein
VAKAGREKFRGLDEWRGMWVIQEALDRVETEGAAEASVETLSRKNKGTNHVQQHGRSLPACIAHLFRLLARDTRIHDMRPLCPQPRSTSFVDAYLLVRLPLS